MAPLKAGPQEMFLEEQAVAAEVMEAPRVVQLAAQATTQKMRVTVLVYPLLAVRAQAAVVLDAAVEVVLGCLEREQEALLDSLELFVERAEELLAVPELR